MDSLIAAAPRFFEILWLNIVLSGDNAVVIGMAAAGLPLAMRNKAVMFGIIAAAVLRIIFSIFATYLLGLWWIAFLGGAALLYIAWTFLKELLHHGEEEGGEEGEVKEKTLGQALWQIVVADVSMSLDNVLAVAGAAREHPGILIVGLIVAVALMGVAANVIARYIERFRWIGWLGLAVIVYVALKMIWEGSHEVMPLAIGMVY